MSCNIDIEGTPFFTGEDHERIHDALRDFARGAEFGRVGPDSDTFARLVRMAVNAASAKFGCVPVDTTEGGVGAPNAPTIHVQRTPRGRCQVWVEDPADFHPGPLGEKRVTDLIDFLKSRIAANAHSEDEFDRGALAAYEKALRMVRTGSSFSL